MKKELLYEVMLFFIPFSLLGQSTIRLTEKTLMHEMRKTPSPLNNAIISERTVSFMYPLQSIKLKHSSALDGMEDITKQTDKSNLRYRIRYSKDSELKTKLYSATTLWPFYNPENKLDTGKWYWQYAYLNGADTTWSNILTFSVKNNDNKFAPPSYKELINKLPKHHPRVWIDKDNWDDFIASTQEKPERSWYLEHANKSLKVNLKHIDDLINTRSADQLPNQVKRNALIVRESRRVVDKEEKNTEALIKAYILTKDKRYFYSSMERIHEMSSWRNSKNLAGDFNASTLLSLSSMAYDAFYNLLTEEQKKMLLKEIQVIGTQFYNRFNNHLENHIADNHTWQMSLRIFTMAAFAAYGDLPEASIWTKYAYNLWIARFPGLNNDGGWHNGDSYFHVNIKTLIEVPMFYTGISGFNFFTDTWYQKNALYLIYQQPPFSKSGGNGSSHQKIKKPNGTRVGYADALAKITGNTYAADYVRQITHHEPEVLKSSFLSKSGDLSWFRLHCNKKLPRGGRALKDLPLAHVFPNTGIASFMSNWSNISKNMMLSFRSSPYGSTSHALANQNAFNVFFGGKPIFYSSGHHVSFTDHHSIYCHRATRAHNTILINGMGQRIGTEGYGWIPRYYVGDNISYVLGDASNAYGNVISPLWLARGKQSDLEYTHRNGWDKNHLKTFRRHVVHLGKSGLIFIYDELEADTGVSWSYLLHTIKYPMNFNKTGNPIIITGKNDVGESNLYLFSSENLSTEQTNRFFYPAVNWLRADDKGYFKPYENHWHFKATSAKHNLFRFMTIIDTHAKDEKINKPVISDESGIVKIDNWEIKANISLVGAPFFEIINKSEKIKIYYNDSTIIHEHDVETILHDVLPELEI